MREKKQAIGFLPPQITVPRLLVALATILLLVIVANKFGDLFVMSLTQRSILNQLENGFARGEKVKMGDFYQGTWDQVCVVPSGAFGMAYPADHVSSYLGDSSFNPFFMPDPMSIHFGLGFTFLDDNKLVRFIRIPRIQYEFFTDGKFISSQPVRLPHNSHNDRYPERYMTLSDLNVSYQRPGHHCYPRFTAYIEVTDYKQLYVGE